MSDEIICVIDVLATCANSFLAICADIFDVGLPDNAGEDSVSHLPVLMGEELEMSLREATVHHSFSFQL